MIEFLNSLPVLVKAILLVGGTILTLVLLFWPKK